VKAVVVKPPTGNRTYGVRYALIAVRLGAGVSGPEMTTENACLRPDGSKAPLRCDVNSRLTDRYDLSASSTSKSEALDNLCDLQYGLELVIPMSSRRLETR
jgi:hypothetical protein